MPRSRRSRPVPCALRPEGPALSPALRPPRALRPRHPAHPHSSRRPSCQVVNHHPTRKAAGRPAGGGRGEPLRADGDRGEGRGAGACTGRSRGGQGGAGPTASQTPPPPGAGLLRAATPKSPELRQTELLRTWQPQPGSAAPDGGTPLTRQYGRGRLPDDKTAPLAG